MRPSIMIAAALAAGLSAPASAEDAYVVGITAALTGPPASTYAPAVEALRLYLERVNAAGGVNGRKVRLAIEDDSAQPSKAAANAKKLLAEDNPVLMLNASLSSTYAPVIAEAEDRRRAADVRKLGMPEGRLSAGAGRRVLHDRFCRDLRQPRRARLREGNGERTGQDRLFRDGHSALARRNGLCRKPGPGARHGRGRQGGHSAADRRLHAVCDQAQGCGRELGVLLGTVGDPGAHLRSFAAPRLVGRLHHLGPYRGRGRAQAHQGREALRHRRQRAVRRRAADPQGDRRSGEAGGRQISRRTR